MEDRRTDGNKMTMWAHTPTQRRPQCNNPRMNEFNSGSEQVAIHEARLWQDNGWTAKVIKNEDDDGWAVAMTPDGQVEPALVGPWTMGRDKKNPKPLDTSAFHTLVKTAAEFVRRHEQQLHATLHQQIEIAHAGGRVSVTLDITPDEESPTAMLQATNAAGEVLGQASVSPGFKLTRASAGAWAERGFGRRAG
jgi:hypothetical protein